MFFIEYKDNHPALLALNESNKALEASLEGMWGTDQMVRSRSYEVDEQRFIQRLEQTREPEKRKQIKHWQNGKRIDHAILILQFEGMVDRIAQAIEAAKRDCDGVWTKLEADIAANIDGESIFWNNYLYTRSLICSATVLVNRYRDYLGKDELRQVCLDAVREVYRNMRDLSLSLMLEDTDKTAVPHPCFFLRTCKITPLSVPHPDYEAMTAALAECWDAFSQADELSGLLVAKEKGHLNEKNYKKQLAEAACDSNNPSRFDELRRMQQVHRSNFSSCKAAAAYHNSRLQEMLDDLCKRCNELRKQALPESPRDQDRWFAACILVHWCVYQLFTWKRNIDKKIWEDPTKGEGHLHKLHDAALQANRDMPEFQRDSHFGTWFNEHWQSGYSLQYLQHYAGHEVKPLVVAVDEDTDETAE